MDVRSDRTFTFANDVATVWAAFTQVGAYRTWWPWLAEFDGVEFAEGVTWRCSVRPPLPYTLHFDLTLTEVQPHRRAAAAVEGDLHGSAALDVVELDGGGACRVRLQSQLSPTHPLLVAVARVARPVVIFGHDWVLDNGLRQFAAKALPGGGEPAT